MSIVVSNQLVTEIEKLKEGDYTSYQNFYNETVQYLYQIIWNNVQDQNAADEILNQLYTDIYAGIATELTDNSQFFNWAENKAQTITTTYLSTHNIFGVNEVSDKDDIAEEATVVIAANAGLNAIGNASGVATAGIGGVGMDVATGGVAQVGMDVAAGGAAQVGMDFVAGGASQAGMGSVAGGATRAGMNAVASGMGQAGMGAGNVAGAVAGVAAKAGLSLGAKIAIFAVAAVAVVGAGVGAFFVINSHKDKEKTTEFNTEAMVADEIVSEEEREDSSEGAELFDKKTAEYMAYYEVINTNMQEHSAHVNYFADGFSQIKGLWNVQLVDLDGDSDEELLIAYSDEMIRGGVCYHHVLEVYDYIDGETVLVGSYATKENTDSPEYLDFYYAIENAEDGKKYLWICQLESKTKKFLEDYFLNICYEYRDGSMTEVHNYWYTTEKDVGGVIDGENKDKETCAALRKEILKSDYDFYYNSQHETDDCPLGYAINKSLIVKHRTIKKIAETCGDTTYSNDTKLPNSWLRKDEVDLAYINENKYKETIEILDTEDTYYNYDINGGSAELSADGQSLHLSKNPNLMFTHVENLNLDYYATYVEDVLIVVGGVDLYCILAESGNNDTYVEYYFWLGIDDYLVNNPMDGLTPYFEASNYEVTQEEFNANVNELMTRQ